MQLMKKNDQYYMVSDKGIGEAQYYNGKCVVKEPAQEISSKFKKTLRDVSQSFDDYSACCTCLSQALTFDEPLLYSRNKSEGALRKDLLEAIWKCETSHRDIPRFTHKNLTEFIYDLEWDGQWHMPRYADHIFVNPITSGGIMNEFISKGSELVFLLSALPFYKAQDEEPYLKEVLENIFERMDYRWNKRDAIIISYPNYDASDYRLAFKLLGYSLYKEERIDGSTYIAIYK